MKSTLTLLAASVMLATASAKADPVILYDNLSINTAATSGGTAGISMAYGGPLADSFSTGSTAMTLADVTLLLDSTSPSDGGFITVSLFSNSGNTPGASLATLGTILDSSLTGSLSDVTVTDGVSLAANTRYWIELSTSGSGRWSFDNTNAGTDVAGEYNKATGSTYSNSVFTPYQMEVDASVPTVTPSATPEPSTVSLTMLGLAGLTVVRRRFIKA